MFEVLDGVRSGDTAVEQNALMIPLGDVFEQMSILASDGQLGDLSSGADFYTDDIHFNNVGRFIASSVFYSVMFGDKIDQPIDQTVMDQFWSNRNATSTLDYPDFDITTQMQAAIQDTVWDTITANPEVTGVPEPATGGIILAGLLLAGRRRRR